MFPEGPDAQFARACVLLTSVDDMFVSSDKRSFSSLCF